MKHWVKTLNLPDLYVPRGTSEQIYHKYRPGQYIQMAIYQYKNLQKYYLKLHRLKFRQQSQTWL